MKSGKTLCFLIYFVLIITSILYSQNSTARFLLWQPSARSIAIGGTGTAIVDNSFATFYNPAGLAFANGINFASSYVKPFAFFDHTVHSLSALSVSVEGFGTLALSANRFWRERQAITDETGPGILGMEEEKFKFFTPIHWEAKLSYAILLSKHASIGLNVSLLRINLSRNVAYAKSEKGKTSTMMFGAGLMFKNILPNTTLKPGLNHRCNFLHKYAEKRKDAGLSLGFSILNAGNKITFIDDSQKDNPPTLASIGFAYWPISSPIVTLMISTDFEKEIFESSSLDYIHFGKEIRLLNIFSVRTGYFLDTDIPKTSYFTFGGGIHFKYFSFNVARYKRSLLPTWHFDGTIFMEI